jgi:hypothetical protein
VTIARLRLSQGMVDPTLVGDRILVRLAIDTSERCVRL